MVKFSHLFQDLEIQDDPNTLSLPSLLYRDPDLLYQFFLLHVHSTCFFKQCTAEASMLGSKCLESLGIFYLSLKAEFYFSDFLVS